MVLRRITAAGLSLLFVALMSTPAFAGVLESIVNEDACCCSKTSEAKDDHAEALEEPECACPACACALSAIDFAPPLDPVISPNPPNLIGLAWTPTWHEAPSVTQSEVSTRAPRGPPVAGGTALYILYDSLLI